MFFGNTRPGPSASSPITPIASSIVIKSVADLQTQIGDELDSFVKDHPVPGPKTAASPELVAAWRTFPRSRPWYSKHIKRLADISASVNAEQAVAELILQWLPPAFGSAQPGQAFMRSQFVFAKFTQRLGCLSVSTAASGNQKELAAKQQEETRNMEVVQTVVCITVCDVLAALLEPRAGRGSPIDPDLGHICVQLAFAQFNPQNDRTRMLEQTMHASLAGAFKERTVVSWAAVVSHLAQIRFDQIVNEFIGRVNPAKTADDVFHILVGTQRVVMPSMMAPAAGPFFDQFRQIVTSDKKIYKDSMMRLCVVYSLELLTRQADCGDDDVDPDAAAALYDKLHAMFLTLQDWAEKAELMMATTQLLALIVCHSPPAFWQAHMDTSKEGKKRSNMLLGGKKEGLLRLLLTDQAYEDKSSRAALCGVLRLLTGGYPLPTSIIGRPSEAEWWRNEEKDHVADGSLMRYTMRTFGAALATPGGTGDDDTIERLRFIVEKLFNRKASSRSVRLPRLLECGDVIVYIVGQIAAHSLVVGLEAIEVLLRDPRDPEYNLLGVCALGRILRAPNLAAALVEQMGYFADRLQTVIERCEHAVGSHAIGLSQRTLPIPSLTYDDSVQLMLSNVGKKKDRDNAVRLAMYREAIGCITLALPPMCLQPHAFVGELVLHADDELATMGSRVVQQLTIEQPQHRRAMLQCFAKMLLRILAEPGGSNMELCGPYHQLALEAMEARLLTVVQHVTGLLDTWATSLPHEPVSLEPVEMELGLGSQVVRLETEMAEIDVAAISLLAHPAAPLRSAGLKLTRSTRGLFYARKAAYDRAVSDRLAFLESNYSDVSAAEAQREIAELHIRIGRVEQVEGFAADIIDSTAPRIVRKAIKRELLESKGGVASELPSEVQLEKMQIPPMEKLFALPAESLAMTSQFCFCLAELGASFLASGCARRAAALRDMLASAVQRLPSGNDLARFIAEGDTNLGVLWRNYYSLLLSVAGGTVAATTRMLHPDSPELKAAAKVSKSPSPQRPPPHTTKSQPAAMPPPHPGGMAPGSPIKAPPTLPPAPGSKGGGGVVLPPPKIPSPFGRSASTSGSGKLPPPLPPEAYEEDPPSGGRSSQRASVKFDRDSGFESGWSKSRSGSLVGGLGGGFGGDDGPPPLPESFNRLVSAELGGQTSAVLAERIAAIGAAPSLPAQGLAGAAAPPPAMLSTASRGAGAPPPMLSGGAPPPKLSQRPGSLAGAGGVPPPPTLSGAGRGSLSAGGLAGGRAIATATELKQVEVMISAAEQAIKPVLDVLWSSLALDASGAVGWAAASVGTIAGCLHHHGALMATESLCGWREALPDKKRKELLLPMARTLRTIAQSDSFRDAVLADAATSEHQRLLQLYLGFIREHTPLLSDPANVARRPFCLELILIVSHVARATTTAVRYDATRWLKPNFVPETLKHAWPLDQRAHLLEFLIMWATWREEEAWRAAQEIGTSKAAMKKQMKNQKGGPQVGSEEERLFFRLETTASQAVKHVTASGPIAAERWLTDGGSWEFEPIYYPTPPKDPDAPLLRRRQTVAFFEKAELEGSETLRYVLGHHFPMLLEPYLRHAYYEPVTSSVYFHAIVDAIIPQDGEALCEQVHAHDDNLFAQEVKRHAAKLMLLALVHLKTDDAKIRSRAFDLACRLTSSFSDGGRPFTCDGRPLAQWRPLYTASLPAPVLLRHHIRALLKAAATQCASLGAGLVGEALGLLMQTFAEDNKHLEALPRSQVLAVLQVSAPWFVNVPLRAMPGSEQQYSAPFVFLRRWAIVGIARDGVDGEALSAYYDAWLQLSAAAVGVTAAMRAPPCSKHQEKAPPNVPIILEFLLHVAGRSDFALELSQQLVLGLFTLAPHTTLDMLLSQISTGRLRPDAPAGPSLRQKRPSLLETFGSMITDTFKKMPWDKGGSPKAARTPTQLTHDGSVLNLGTNLPTSRPKSISSARGRGGSAVGAIPSDEPERVVVDLSRGANGGLGIGFSPEMFVTNLAPGSPAEACGKIRAGDQLVSINGTQVRPQMPIGPLLPPPTSQSPIEFVFLRVMSEEERMLQAVAAEQRERDELDAREAAAAAEAAEAAAREEALFNAGDDGPVEYATTADEDELLLPSGGLQESGDPPVLASSKEQRASALQLMVEPIRQGFCDPCGKRALVDALPVMLTMLLTLFDSQTHSKVSVEELNTLRAILSALLTGVLEARRAATGAAAAPFSEAQEELPAKYATLLRSADTKGFKIRWPRLFADATATYSTPTVANAYEITNFLPVSEAIGGLLECVEEWGQMRVASEWAAVARSWLDASTDTVVRFKTLATLRLLLPYLTDAELDVQVVSSVAGALYAGLAELQAAMQTEEDETKRQTLLEEATYEEPLAPPIPAFKPIGFMSSESSKEPRRGSVLPAATVGAEGTRAPIGKRPPALALAEEALAILHDIAKRKDAAGELGRDGLGGTLLWTAVGLCGTIYPSLLAELYPMLALLLGSKSLRELIVSGAAPPPPPKVGSARDPFAAGLLQMLLEGLRAAGWWGPKQTARSGHTERRHLLPVSMQPTIVLAVRHACAIHAQRLLPDVGRGQAVLPDPKGGAKVYGASSTPLLECLMLQLPAMYELISQETGGVISEGQRVAFEPLAAAAALIDKMLGVDEANSEAPSMTRALERFFGGQFAGEDRRAAAAQMLAELCQPLFAAYLPSHSVQLAQMLTRLLQAGPVTWEEPLMLLVAYALQHPEAPTFVDHFHLVVQLCVNGDSEAAVYCLSSAMQAAARGGDKLTAVDMGSGKPFDEIGHVQFYTAEGKDLENTRDVLPGMVQALDAMRA